MEQTKYSDLLTQVISEKKDFYPLSQSQLGIYLECIKNHNTTMYNIPYSYAFPKSDVQLERLMNAVKTAILNHEILFCSIAEKNSEIGMNSRPSLQTENNVEIPVFKTSESDVENEMQNHIKPFNMEKDLLFRAAIFETETRFHLFMDFHHIVFDGSSIGIISSEIENAYNGVTLDKESMSATKLGLFEQKLEEENYYDEGKEFFKKSLLGLESKTMLLPDVNIETENKNAGFSFSTKGILSASEVEKFNGGKGIGAFFIAVFSYAIAKFLGQEESVIYTPNHGRNEERMKNAIGMMVRTLPIFTKIDESQTIAQYLSNAKSNIIGTIKNGNYPFTKLAQEYDLSMDIDIAYQGDIFNKITIDGKNYFMEGLTQGDSLSPFTLMIIKEGDDYRFRVFYRADLYTQDYIKSFLEFYAKVVSEFLKKEKLCEIEFLTDEQKTLLDNFNQTETEYDRTKTIVDLFRESAAKNPKNIAVVYLDKKFTYKEVDEISDKIASYINSLGIGKENVISILISRSEWMPITALGVLKSGAAYQPLDPIYPKERLEFMIKDSFAKLLICDEDLRDLVSDYKDEILFTKDIPSLRSRKETLKQVQGDGHAELVSASPQPSDLFILLYTSGTTGTPKGAMLEHGNIAAFCNWYRRYYNLTEKSKTAAYASFGFDANMMDTYPILTAGGELHIIPENMRLDIVAMNNYFEQNAITHGFMTTQVGRAFATSLENKSLLHFSTGGEALSPLEIPQNYKFYNLYGPTECTVSVTSFMLDKFYKKIPIGKANENTKFYIIDKFGRRLPVGANGELCIAGYQVSRGYLNRPEQTEKIFTKNPFCQNKGYERIYHTGDVVRYLTDGNIDFVGRNDGQVKIRGFRIELTEVEKIIREFDGIKDAAVVAFDDAGGGKYVAAYIVSDTQIDIGALNDFIAQNKPPYMVPAVTTQIEKIPLNVNGKVDKRKLPKAEPAAESETNETAETKPATVLEEKIMQIVENILGHKNISVSSNLLKSGFTSLSIIKFAVALNKEFGFEANVKNMMKGCSVLSVENEVVNYLIEKAKSPTSDISSKPSVIPSEVEESNSQKDVSTTLDMTKKTTYPLSSSQFGVYADTMKNPTTTLYNIPMAMSFSKSADTEKLRDAVQSVLSAHPYIFTHLAIEGDDVLQVREAINAPEIPIMEMTDAEFENYKNGFVQPFDLMRAPLFRFVIIKTPSATNLLCDFHHIIFDGASLDIFMRQLKTVLEGGKVETEKFTCYDYVDNEEKFLQSYDAGQSEKFFAEMLKECEAASEIPSDLNGKIEDGNAVRLYAKTDFETAKKFSEQNGLNPSHIYMAAVCYAVARFTNNQNVFISTISNGRSDIKLAESFGMFVKTIPVGVALSDCTSLDFAKSVGKNFMGAIENEMYPYSQICSKFNYSPDVMFAYQLGVMDDFVVNGEKVDLKPLALNKPKFKINILIEQHDGTPCIILEYNDALYSKSLMQTLLSAITSTLASILAAPNNKVRKISILTEESRNLLERFNSTKVQLENLTAPQLFEKQVELNSDKTAVIDNNESLSYRQLNENANKIAHTLIQLGVKADDIVGVMMPRTVYAYVAREGILKSGGAFMPLAVDYPDERVKYIFESAKSSVIVTTRALATERKALFDECSLKVVTVEDAMQNTKTDNPPAIAKPQNLAYCIFTSGSTGKPKGVMLEHHSLVNFVNYNQYNQQAQEFCENMSVSLALAAFTFDVSVLEETMPLYHGTTVAIASEEEIHNPLLLAEMLVRNKVDVMKCTPSFMLSIIDIPETLAALKQMKAIDIGAEVFPPSLYGKMRSSGITAKIYNGYGPTEATITTSIDYLESEKITIGKPLSNTQCYILDSDDNILPPLVQGELLICGECVGRGYVANEKLTAEKFIDFNGTSAYRSGDFAMWNLDGKIECFGRKDNQVKIRGLRVELDEIENVINTHTKVSRSVVIVRNGKNNEAYLCGYYTATEKVSAEELTQHIKKSLAPYMVPPILVQLDAMPMNANGKIDKKSLPATDYAVKRDSVKPPKNETEKSLCQIFSKVLGVDEVGADDSFFELGGSSLSVTRLVIAAQKAGFKFAYADVFSHPTPESLAQLATGGEERKSEFEDLGNYDYTKINEVLAKNTLENFKAGKKQELGDVLLTGATGFLGIHVLYELLHSHSGKVYCLLRGKGTQTAKQRLNGLFFYYFDEIPSELFKDRLEIIEGDITKPESFEKFSTQLSTLNSQLSTVINCAANVKHFSKGNDIELVNYNGVLNILDFCKKKNANLVHVSTMSVSGISPKEGLRLHENELYIGQHQISKYTQSKYMAERAILQAATEGLGVKIMRVGNLSARDKDGEFQMNFKTNSFMGRLKSAYLIGKEPFESLEQNFEFSPIDYVAKSILLLATSPKDCVVFHPYNNHPQMMADLYSAMNSMNLEIDAVEKDEYKAALENAMRDKKTAEVLSSMIAYQGLDSGFYVGKENSYTMQVLYRLGFNWPVTSKIYMRKFIGALKTLGFFGKE